MHNTNTTLNPNTAEIPREVDSVSSAEEIGYRVGGEEENISLPLFDCNHNLISHCSFNKKNGHTITPIEITKPCYIQFGGGSEVIISSCIADAIALHQTGVGTRTIAPLQPEDLIDICVHLKRGFPNHQHFILGRRDHSHHIVVAKQEINASSEYPPAIYNSWSEFIDQKGVVAVTEFLHRNDTEANAVDSFVVKDDHVRNIEEQRFIFENLIISQHIIVICAEPNAGKTTIMNWVCSKISETTDVRYLNLDCSGSELKGYQSFAQNNGFEFINFDITGTKEEDFFKVIKESKDLTGKLYVLDTMKKLVDPMKKDQMKTFMKLLRTLCIKGATFVLLAHTNKHKTKDGLPVFEGVGDVKADCDELIYLTPKDNENGTKTVTTTPDKTRGHFAPITFIITPDRSVSLTEYVDLVAENRLRVDGPVISAIRDALAAGKTIQKDIVEACNSKGIGKRGSRRALEGYSMGENRLWSKTKGDNNAWVYTMI